MVKAQPNQQQANEKRLFHGTSPRNVAIICGNNFDPRLHRNGTEFSEGVSFAVNASYSHRYATREIDRDLSQFMFLAKILVGSYTVGHTTCVDDRSNPTIFVVADTQHFYPEYIIKYSSVDHMTSAYI